MNRCNYFSRSKRRWAAAQLHAKNHAKQGFTLLELLVVTAIAGGIVAGLMFVVVQLMNTDAREASRSETQREMQMAMDYMSTEVRQAVYVYTGQQLANVQANGVSQGPLTNYLPTALSQNSTPVLAFWKQQQFPTTVRNNCRDRTATQYPYVNCEAGYSYALVVYSLSTSNPNNIWQGTARITRYVLSEFDNSGNFTVGYVNPGTFNNFGTWPYGHAQASANLVNLQSINIRTPPDPDTRIGRPNNASSITPLVDFVDNTATTPRCNNEAGVAYDISPSTSPRGFYACISVRDTGTVNGQTVEVAGNQDVILYVKGNVVGRSGYLTPGFANNGDTLPTLETRVLARGVLDRAPGQ